MPHTLTYTRDLLADVAAQSTSISEMMRRLGIRPAGGTHAYLSKRLRHYDIDTSHFTHLNRAQRKLIPKEELAPAVAAGTSVAGVMRALNLADTNSSRRLVRLSAATHGIDTSHFTGSRYALGKASPSRRPAADILALRRHGSRRERPTRLRRALDEIGRDYRCCGCGNDGTWRGRPLVLEIDHVNGDWLDNRAENLRYLCPSCHSQTPTYRGRNRGRA